MLKVAWFLTDLLDFFYQLSWLVFLTRKHYGQVTSTAGHIFELNVLLQNTLAIFWILLVDSGALDGWCTISDMLTLISMYNIMVAIAGSQIETAIFLKTLNVNTMMTNTAGKIILAMSIFTSGIAVIITLVHPSRKVCLMQSETTFCEYMKMDIYRIIPGTLFLIPLIFAVLGFTIFRSYQIFKKEKTR